MLCFAQFWLKRGLFRMDKLYEVFRKSLGEVRDVITDSIKRSPLCGMLETAELENSLMYQVPFYDRERSLGNYRVIIAKDEYRSGKCYVVKAVLSGR